MKTSLLFITLCTIILLAFVLIPDLVTAQAPPPPPVKPEQNPIDGGLGILALAGGAYAIKRLKKKE